MNSFECIEYYLHKTCASIGFVFQYERYIRLFMNIAMFMGSV